MKKVLMALSLFLCATAAYGGTVHMVFVSYNGSFTDWTTAYPYHVLIGGALTDVMCDDWIHGGKPNDKWDANVTDLGTGNLTLLRWNTQPNALTLYDEAGWLLLETQVTPSTEWKYINYAVWHTFDNSAPLPGDAQNWIDLAVQEANAGFPGVNFHQVEVLTPLTQYDSNPDGAQEFLTITPEPTTFVLLGAGLVGLWVGRKIS